MSIKQLLNPHLKIQITFPVKNFRRKINLQNFLVNQYVFNRLNNLLTVISKILENRKMFLHLLAKHQNISRNLCQPHQPIFCRKNKHLQDKVISLPQDSRICYGSNSLENPGQFVNENYQPNDENYYSPIE